MLKSCNFNQFIVVIIAFSSFLLISKTAKSIAHGCYIDSTKTLYTSRTSPGGGGLNNRYFYTTASLYSECGFEDTGRRDGDCYLYKGSGSISNSSNYITISGGFDNKWEEIENCPLDDYVWIMLFAISSISILKFRRFVT